MDEKTLEQARLNAEANAARLTRERAVREATRRHREFLAREAAKAAAKKAREKAAAKAERARDAILLATAPTTDDLASLEAMFSKPKTKATPVVTTVDNNGWGKTWTPEQLANTVIDSDIKAPAIKTKADKQKENSKKKN